MRERDMAEFAILAELVDWDEPDDDDERDDYIVDDVEVSGRYGCDAGRYFVEANSGPGWVR